MITEVINILAKREDLYNCLLKAEIFKELERDYTTSKLTELIIDRKNGAWGEDFLKDGCKVKVLRSQDIRHGFINYEQAEIRYVSKADLEKNKLDEGDILVIKSNGSEDLVGKSQIFYSNQIDTVIPSNFLMRIRPNQELVLPDYLDLFLKSPQALKWRVDKQSSTTGLRNLDTGGFLSVDVPLPSIEEQKLIIDDYYAFLKGDFSSSIVFDVARIKKFKNICSVLNDTSIEFDKQQTYLQLLRQTILQEAVQGKLTKQDPKEEPATELLKRIKAEKEKLIKEGKLKKEKELPPIAEDEIPFELPEGWVWCRLDDIARVGTGATPLTSNKDYYKGTIPWITSSATGSLFVTESQKYISEKALKETNCRVYPVGTLIVAMYGQGKTRGQITELLIESATNQACAALELIIKDNGHKKYIKYFFQKIYFQIRTLAEGGAQPNLNLQKIKGTVVPLPPIAEQQRIVAKMQKLQQQLSTLEAEVQQSREYAQKLLQSVLREAFGENEKKDRAVERSNLVSEIEI